MTQDDLIFRCNICSAQFSDYQRVEEHIGRHGEQSRGEEGQVGISFLKLFIQFSPACRWWYPSRGWLRGRRRRLLRRSTPLSSPWTAMKMKVLSQNQRLNTHWLNDFICIKNTVNDSKQGNTWDNSLQNGMLGGKGGCPYWKANLPFWTIFKYFWVPFTSSAWRVRHLIGRKTKLVSSGNNSFLYWAGCIVIPNSDINTPKSRITENRFWRLTQEVKMNMKSESWDYFIPCIFARRLIFSCSQIVPISSDLRSVKKDWSA